MAYVDQLNLKPGTTSYLDLPVGHTGLAELSLPLIVVNGSQPGPTLGITAAIHGCEYIGVATCVRLGKEIDPGALRGRLLIVPVANVRAFEMRFPHLNPLDHANLNRVFPGKRYGSMSEQMAYAIYHEVIAQSDVFMDLHSGDADETIPLHTCCQRVGIKEVDEKSEAMARLFDIEWLNIMGEGIDELTGGNEEEGTFFAGIQNPSKSVGAASLAGIPSVMLEVGQAGMLDLDLVDLEVRGTREILRYLGMIDGAIERTIPHRVCYGMFPIRTRFGGLFFPAVKPGDVVRKGEPLGEMQNLRGEVVARFTSPMDAAVVMLYSYPVRMSGSTLMNLAWV